MECKCRLQVILKKGWYSIGAFVLDAVIPGRTRVDTHTTLVNGKHVVVIGGFGASCENKNIISLALPCSRNNDVITNRRLNDMIDFCLKAGFVD